MSISIEDIARFKAEAVELKTTQRMKHCAALEFIARREGFRNWPELLAEVGTAQEVSSSIRTLGLRGPRVHLIPSNNGVSP